MPRDGGSSSSEKGELLIYSTVVKRGSDSGENKEITKLKESLQEKEKELAKAKSSEDAMKKQANNLTEEYDRLMKEHQKVLKKMKTDVESKKDS